MDNTFSFTAISKVELGGKQGETQSALVSASLRLEISGNLKHSTYILPDGAGPTKDGAKGLDIALITGLATNLQYGVKKGWWTAQEHFGLIISELQRIMDSMPDDIVPS